MKRLIAELNAATQAYDLGNPYLTDKEWDEKYFKLVQLEKRFGIIYPNSPTQTISYQVKSALDKVTHEIPMLSLKKTKELSEVNDFINGHPSIMMLKLDGLTVACTYEGGRLVKAETRGNGLVGEDITHNAFYFKELPLEIPYKKHLVVFGEAIITYPDFEKFATEYKNPRNLVSGSVRQLDSRECEKRNVSFMPWRIASEVEEYNTLHEQLDLLNCLGFSPVPFVRMFNNDLRKKDIDDFVNRLSNQQYPIDGLVISYDDISYMLSLGATDHHLRGQLAFKFYDEEWESSLLDIEWTMGRTGVLTPVAVFEPIDTGESIIERASLHNINIMQEVLHQPFKNQVIYVVKQNQIIPQITRAEYTNDNPDYEYFTIPDVCPVCGGRTQETETLNSIVLNCLNPECQGKLINRLEHWFSKKGLDIKGLSKSTLEKLIDWGWVNEPADIFKLSQYREEWVTKFGFGEKSVDKILGAIETSKQTSLEKFVAAIGIPHIGARMAKELCKHIDSYEDLLKKVQTNYDFSSIDKIAENKTESILTFDYTEANAVYQFLTIEEQKQEEIQQGLKNEVIVITGSLESFKNRTELQSFIEQHGGRVSSSISKNTTLLINNNINSTSAKNKKAKELNIPILTEKDFLQKFDF